MRKPTRRDIWSDPAAARERLRASSAASSWEFRVIWQREGKPKRRAIYQTLAGAERCVNRQVTAREEMDWLLGEDGIDLRPSEIVFGPIIEAREVGPWLTQA